MSLTPFIIGLFLGILGSLIVAMFVEWKRKPQLSISIPRPEEVPLYSDGKKIGTLIALRVRVSNDSLPFALCWMQRQSARDCRATVYFLREDGTPFINDPMPGRWAGSVEPVPLQGVIRPSGETIEIHDITRLNTHRANDCRRVRGLAGRDQGDPCPDVSRRRGTRGVSKRSTPCRAGALAG